MSHLLTGSKVNWVLMRERDVTVICQDDDVKTTVEANLLQAVHQLTHDPVNVLDGQNQLQDTKTSRTPHRWIPQISTGIKESFSVGNNISNAPGGGLLIQWRSSTGDRTTVEVVLVVLSLRAL